MTGMYDVPTDGCNLEIMGYPFFAETVTPNEGIRRRNMNINNIVGGTQKITKGEYIGLDFDITTHVKVNPTRPDMWFNIFTEMMSKPVRVSSPEMGAPFNAFVVIKPEHETPDYLKLSINIKEVPDKNSKIPGESFKVPKSRKITVKKTKKSKTDSKPKNKIKTKTKTKTKTKKGSVTKKTKSKNK